MPIDSTADHVAVMVPDVSAAAERWHDRLGGGWVLPRFVQQDAGFAGRQVRYRNGAKLEILEPIDDDGFAARFLSRFGPRVHHLTLKLPDLLEAVGEVRGHGYDVVDVFTAGDVWHEAFLRPSQVGGLIVQIAWAANTDDERAEGVPDHPEPPAEDGAELLGPTLTHPDLDAATKLWEVLGADVDRDGDVLRVSWRTSPLTVEIHRGVTAGPVGLRYTGTPSLPADAVAGPAVLA